MNPTELQQKLCSTLTLHVGEEMARYILARAAQGGRQSFPILATDARTGQPLHGTIDPAILSDPQLSLF